MLNILAIINDEFDVVNKFNEIMSEKHWADNSNEIFVSVNWKWLIYEIGDACKNFSDNNLGSRFYLLFFVKWWNDFLF